MFSLFLNYPLNPPEEDFKKKFAYPVSSTKPPESPGGGLILAGFEFFCPPSGGMGGWF